MNPSAVLPMWIVLCALPLPREAVCVEVEVVVRFVLPDDLAPAVLVNEVLVRGMMGSR